MKYGWSFVVAVVASVSLAWAGEPAKVTLKVEGMTCGGCVAAVKVQLKKTEGVTAYEVSLERGEAAVSYDPTKTTPETIAESVSKTGFPASVKRQRARRPQWPLSSSARSRAPCSWPAAAATRGTSTLWRGISS
jgi:copper chaperone